MAKIDTDVQRGLEILQQLKQTTQPAPIQQADPDIQRGLAILNQMKSQQSPTEESLLDTALQFGRGALAANPGQMVDLAQGNNIPTMYGDISPQNFRGSPELVAKMTGKNPEEIRDIYQKADKQALPELHAEKKLTGLYDKIAGKDLTPKTTRGEIAQTAGTFFSPDLVTKPIKFGKAIYKGGEKLLKRFGKDLFRSGVSSTGASAAIHAPGHLTEEGGAGRAAEDLGRAVIGGIGGAATAQPIQAFKGIKEGLRKTASLAMSLGTSPEKEVLTLAKKHGIQLPHNVGAGTGMGARLQDFLANNYLSRNIFSSSKYKQGYTNADDALMSKLKEVIGTETEAKLKPSEASSQFKHSAKIEETKAKKTAEKLYDESRKHLTENDKIIPTNTQKAFQDLNKILDTPIRGSDNKEVTKILAELGGNWGLFKPSEVKKIVSSHTDANDLKKMMMKFNDAFAKGNLKEIPAEEMVKAMQGINAIVGSKDTTGVKNLLKGLKGAIAKDLESSTNKSFLEANKAANEFYRENIGKRFRGKSARSILRDEGAVEAYGHLNSVVGIKKLENMAGTSEQAIKNLDALKKLKAAEIFEKAIDGSLENGKLRKGAFAKIFEKGEKNQEVLERLIGKKQYKDLEEISKIARSFSEHGKELLGTSHTASTLTNLGQGQAVAALTVHALFNAEPASLATAATIVGAPYAMSRIMSNPNIIRQARVYALARQKGNEKFAQATMNNLLKMIQKEQQPILRAASEKSKEGEKDEH